MSPLEVMVTQGSAGDRGLQGIWEGRFSSADILKEKSDAKDGLQPAESKTANN